MKVLSLLQPWASLIALGEKQIETRSWQTDYRGPLLIHASKSLRCANEAWKEPFYAALKPLHSMVDNKPSIQYSVGAIIAKCNLVDCVKIVSRESYHSMACLEGGRDVTGKEFKFGDYTPGRYAWLFEDIELLPELIPAKGQLKLWEYPFNEGGKS